MQGNDLRKKKVSTKKTSKILKKSSPRASDTGKVSYKHNAPDLWDRGSITIPAAYMRRPIKSKYCFVTTQNSDAENISDFVSRKYTFPSARQALIRVFNTARPQRDTLALIKRRNVTTNTLEAIYQDEIWHALIVARMVTHWFITTKSALVQVGNPSDRNNHYTQAESVGRHHISGYCNYTSKRKRCSKQTFGKLTSSNRHDCSP